VGASDAEDVVADVFSTAWRHLDNVPDSSLPWLYRTAWNAIGNHRRRTARQANLTVRLASEGGLSVPGSDPAELNAVDYEVGSALAVLSENDREAIRLVCWEQLSIRDAASVLNCSEVAMKVRLHRARRRLAIALETHRAPGSRTPAIGARAPLEHRS
jgi:RNA polymerase sigma-70 factor, ECF subfamily